MPARASSATLGETVCEIFGQLGDGTDLSLGRLDIVRHPVEAHRRAVKGRERRAWVTVSGLPDRADVDDRALTVDGIRAPDLLGALEAAALGVDARDMAVADEADLGAVEQLEAALEPISRRSSPSLRHHILLDRVPRRAVDQQHDALAVASRSCRRGSSKNPCSRRGSQSRRLSWSRVQSRAARARGLKSEA